jgi:ABC-type polysaccharide/polyol phosphate transport system ATPase subunit
MAVVLRVDSVSKQYRIYDRPSFRLRESLTRGRWKAHREFWALSNVSFEIKAGTTTGIIGPNGSGKSTLLQIITGTLQPTHGSVSCAGRVGALLELGAGFNPEFTGTENIFMNAMLNGLSKQQTEQLLPQIAGFAEIGDFLYQPIKTYSSGMLVRLAFATAIVTEPAILIIDEVLAVGDAVFQHRCIRRIKEMQQNGTTVLFVSHDPGAIRALCSRAILLNGGRVEADGRPTEVLNRYQKIIMAREEAFDEQRDTTSDVTEKFSPVEVAAEINLSQDGFRHGDRTAEVLKVQLLTSSLNPVQLVETGEPLVLRMSVIFYLDVENPVCGFLIRNRHGIHLYGMNTAIQHLDFGPVTRGDVIELNFAFNCWLAPDTYSVTVAAHSVDAISFDWLDNVLYFQVISPIAMDGVANLDANVTVRRIASNALKDKDTFHSCV